MDPRFFPFIVFMARALCASLGNNFNRKEKTRSITYRRLIRSVYCASLGRRSSIGDTYHYHVKSTLGSFGTRKQRNKRTPGCLLNISAENPVPCLRSLTLCKSSSATQVEIQTRLFLQPVRRGTWGWAKLRVSS